MSNLQGHLLICNVSTFLIPGISIALEGLLQWAILISGFAELLHVRSIYDAVLSSPWIRGDAPLLFPAHVLVSLRGFQAYMHIISYMRPSA